MLLKLVRNINNYHCSLLIDSCVITIIKCILEAELFSDGDAWMRVGHRVIDDTAPTQSTTFNVLSKFEFGSLAKLERSLAHDNDSGRNTYSEETVKSVKYGIDYALNMLTPSSDFFRPDLYM